MAKSTMTRIVWLCVRNMTVLIWACYIAAWFGINTEAVLIAGGTFWGGELLLLMVRKRTKDKGKKEGTQDGY